MKRFRIPIVLFVLLFTFLIFKNPSEIIAAFTQYKLGLNNGLVAYYTFDGKDMNWGTGRVTDASGNGRTGTIQNMSTTSSPVAGKSGQALAFDGVNDYIAVSGISIPDWQATGMTVSMWVKNFPIDSDDLGMFEIWDSSDNAMRMRIAASHFVSYKRIMLQAGREFSPREIEVHYPAGGSALTDTASWHHVVFVASSTSGALYYDAAESGTDSNITTFGSFNFDSIRIGGSVSDYNADPFVYYTPVTIDDVRIYNRALVPLEIAQLYKLGGTKTNVSPIPTASTPLGSGLVGYWTFDGKDTNWATGRTNDLSGNGYTGSFQNMSTSTTPTSGKIGQAFSFNGTNRYINAGDINAIDGVTRMTASVWMKTAPGVVLGTEKHIFDKSTCTSGAGVFELEAGYIAPNKVDFFINDNVPTGYSSGASVTSVDDGKWHLVTGTYDGSFVRIYVDGTEEHSTSAPGLTLNSNAFNVELGGNCNGTAGYFFNGSLDDARLYSRALSASEIKQLYNHGATKFGASPTNTKMPLNSGLIGYWTFDGKDTNWGTGRTTDMSGNGYVGTFLNMSTSTSPVAGKVGQGFYFDGVDDVVRIMSSVPSVTAFTLALWVKSPNAPVTTSITRPFVLYDRNVQMVWNHTTPDVSNTIGWVSTIGSFNRLSYGTITPNKWHHIVATYDGGTSLIVYNNASSTGSAVTSGTIDQGGGSRAHIGAGTGVGAGDAFFNGSIDDVRLYNRALTATEVAQLYQVGQSTIR